jgi:hypothetical protein
MLMPATPDEKRGAVRRPKGEEIGHPAEAGSPQTKLSANRLSAQVNIST